MSTTMDRIPLSGAQPEVQPLPEPMRVAGVLLFTADTAAAILAIVLCAALFHAAIPAFFTVTATLFIAAAIGRYRSSFAVTARDEWYAAAAVLLPGLAVGALLSAALGFPWAPAILAALVWFVATGFMSVRLHRVRRSGVSYSGALPHVRMHPRSTTWEIEQHAIRALDVVFAALGILLLAPVMLIIALVVVIDDGGPALFGQRRVGRDDRDFTMYKVRTMRSDAGTAWVAQPGDTRITRVGAALRRTSLDELPQLFNVVRGDMSLVGPRPEMQEYASRFTHEVENYWQRHRVRPGITGWAQLYLPRTLTPEDAPVVLSHDLFYVEHAGLYLYLQCLIKTGAEIFAHRPL